MWCLEYLPFSFLLVAIVLIFPNFLLKVLVCFFYKFWHSGRFVGNTSVSLIPQKICIFFILMKPWIICSNVPLFWCHSADATHALHRTRGLQGQRNPSKPLLHSHPLHWICRQQGCCAHSWRRRVHQQAQWLRSKMAYGDCSVILSEWCAVQTCWTLQQRDSWIWVQRCSPGTRNASPLIHAWTNGMSNIHPLFDKQKSGVK